ncbi:MAG: ABC transporter ATP-binding protein [SAR324 cluster bacterium]|nr:ABC transporter ATP-binding protein [SAR324 cluster bacterium]
MDTTVAPIFELEDICFSYPEVQVLEDLQFSMNAGEKLGLMGSTGTGKTTLLHIMIGLLIPTSGTVAAFGKTMNSEKDFVSVRKQAGFLFQHSDQQLFSPTVLEDVAFGPLNSGMSSQEAKEISWQTLRSLKLEDLADRVTHRLSGGQKKLVALATVLSMSPKVLLLDEPTTGLDPVTKNHVMEILHHLDISYLIVSHHLDFLQQTSKKIIMLEHGRLISNQ